jgi:hypothetical protein
MEQFAQQEQQATLGMEGIDQYCGACSQQEPGFRYQRLSAQITHWHSQAPCKLQILCVTLAHFS